MPLLFVDTETSSLPDFKLRPDHPSQPHIVSLAAWLGEWDAQTQTVSHIASLNETVIPDGWHIAPAAQAVHGISEEYARAFGSPIDVVLTRLLALTVRADDGANGGLLVAHNTSFDHRMILRDCAHAGIDHTTLGYLRPFCTMKALTQRMKLPPKNGKFNGARRDSYKWPRLDEAYAYMFDGRVVPGRETRHDAMADVLGCKDIYEEGRRREWW